MKKNLTLLIILPLLVLISACKKNNDVVVPNKTIITNVASTAWVLSADKLTYSVNIDLPELTNDIFDTDGVLVYISSQDGLYEQIPEVYDEVAYSYSVSPGSLEIDVQDPIKGLDAIRPPDLKVKIVLIPSSF